MRSSIFLHCNIWHIKIYLELDSLLTTSGSCHAIFYPILVVKYCTVCGRVIGYQIGSTGTFEASAVGHTIGLYYVYGVSVTRGAPWNHIYRPWQLVYQKKNISLEARITLVFVWLRYNNNYIVSKIL